MSKFILYLGKIAKLFLLFLLTPRELILRQRDKIYSLKLSTKVQGYLLASLVIVSFWIIYSSLFYVKFDELIISKNKKISELNDNLFIAKKDQKKLNELEKEYSETVSVFLESTENNLQSIEKTILETGINPNELVKRSIRDFPSGGPFISDENEINNDNNHSHKVNYKLEKLEALRNIVPSLPLIAPLDYYWVSSNFGKRKDPVNGRKAMHYGIDLVAQTSTSIMSTASGIVTYSGKKDHYGKMVEIDHGYGLKTRYGHLVKVSKKKGEIVAFREEVGKLGSSGRVTGPHLHYEVLYDYKALNPAKFINAGKNVFKKNKINIFTKAGKKAFEINKIKNK